MSRCGGTSPARAPRMSSPPERDGAAGAPRPPDFVGVGASGSGIAWWHSLLLAHPEIAPARGRRRALHFFDEFCARELTGGDVAAYCEQFPHRPGKLRGEWTGRYMADAWTPPLLRRAAPDAKLLMLLSDPIERYRAVFGAQLARLQRFFDPAQILVLQYERCRRDPLGQYRRTLEFLGVRDTAFAPLRLRGVP